MRVSALLLSLVFLAGCFASLPDGNGTAAYTWNDPVVLTVGKDKLIGQATTIRGTNAKGISSYRMTQQFEASNGLLTCTTPLNERWGAGSDGQFAGKSYNTKVTCSDGTSGKMRITTDVWQGVGFANHGFKGMGIGKLTNGIDLKMVFGPSINVTNTNF